MRKKFALLLMSLVMAFSSITVSATTLSIDYEVIDNEKYEAKSVIGGDYITRVVARESIIDCGTYEAKSVAGSDYITRTVSGEHEEHPFIVVENIEINNCGLEMGIEPMSYCSFSNPPSIDGFFVRHGPFAYGHSFSIPLSLSAASINGCLYSGSASLSALETTHHGNGTFTEIARYRGTMTHSVCGW